jgi:hypothetical protein
MDDMYLEQDLAPGLFPPHSNGSPLPSREHLREITQWNARKLSEIQLGINEANEGGGQPSLYYNH